MRALLQSAADRAIRYLETVGNRPVAPDPAAVAALTGFDEALPDGPTPPADTLALLDELGSPATMAMAGPRFFGFVIGGALPAPLAAQWLATAWDQNAALARASPVAARLESVALRWLLEILDLPRESAAGFVTGGTMANFTALAAARHRLLARAGWNVEADGLAGAPPITVIAGAEAHPTLFKALGLLGLGRDRVRRVAVDRQGRMLPDALTAALADLSGPTLLCTQVGNINSGDCDPVGELCARLARSPAGANGWVHVDGAFGLWARAVPQLKELVAGVEAADSWATDAHKWLNTPYDSGLALVRDGEALRAAMAVTAAYLPGGGADRDPCDYVPELSRRARGIEVWAALRSLGRQGIADLVGGCVRHAQRFASGLRAAGYEVLNDVVLNQVVVAFGDAATTNRVIAALQAEGTCWCGTTQWQGRTAMRISVSSWATREEDVERSLKAMLAVAGAAAATRS